jgi:hypothetical protein
MSALMLDARLDEDAVLANLAEWRAWVKRGGGEPVPAWISRSDWSAVGSAAVHAPIRMLRILATKMSLPSVAARLAQLRIRTDGWSYEIRACGLNRAWCTLGLACVARGDLQRATECLDEAWRVHPCPHNTSFGLAMELSQALDRHEPAREVVARYRRIASAFATSRQ